jgi:hypothetical protein
MADAQQQDLMAEGMKREVRRLRRVVSWVRRCEIQRGSSRMRVVQCILGYPRSRPLGSLCGRREGRMREWEEEEGRPDLTVCRMNGGANFNSDG